MIQMLYQPGVRTDVEGEPISPFSPLFLFFVARFDLRIEPSSMMGKTFFGGIVDSFKIMRMITHAE